MYLNETFKYQAIYNEPGKYEVLFKPSRKQDWRMPGSHPINQVWRRFAICTNETDAATISAVMNKWDEEGNDWVHRINTH